MKISLFILDSDDVVDDVRKSHFSIFPHLTQCNIYRHVYRYPATLTAFFCVLKEVATPELIKTKCLSQKFVVHEE